MRLAVGLIAAVVPLVGAGAAQAAIAGAPQPSFSVRPTYINSALTGASTARFCFDKQVIVNNPTGFGLSGYDTDIVLTSTDATASGNCVNATFSTSSQNGDLGSYTVGEVAEGAVRGLSGEGNRADDTPLSGAGNNNGTTGHETAPDLVKTQYVGSGGANQMAFTFDQQLNSNSVNVAANAFHVVFSTGPNCPPGLTV
ncbi:MAG: hypothetical protein JO086_04640, partial [Acidimicrobiia bacterium]|nr:hypothetical protein [Acidimicrobiia bacterium]